MAERTRGQRVLDALAPYLVTVVIALPFVIFFALRLRGPDVQWRHRGALFLLAAVPLVAWVSFHLERRRVGTLLYTRTRDLGRTAQGLFGRLIHLPQALRIVAIALVAVALARPQKLSNDVAEVEGIDIVVALDVSNSMREQDMLPDRLEAAKKVIDKFVAKRE